MLLLLELQNCRQADYGVSDTPFDMREESHKSDTVCLRTDQGAVRMETKPSTSAARSNK